MLPFEISIQRQVITAALDDFTPNSALPNVRGGQFGDAAQEWRECVIDFLGAMLQAGLIEPLPGREGYGTKPAPEIQALLLHGDLENGFDVDLLWDVIHFSGTRKLSDIVGSLGLKNWESLNSELSRPLGQALEALGVARL